jgi:HSP20 family protein
MLTLWNGFDRHLNAELRNMDRFMSQAFRPLARPSRPAASSLPKVDVVETDQALVLEAEVPGMTANDITVSLHEGVLVIEGMVASETNEQSEPSQDGPRYIVRERRDTSFRRSFKLGRDLDPNAVSATVKDGVLRVSMPKREPVQPRQIAVGSE